VDHQLEFGGLHDRKISGLLALEYPAGKDSGFAVCIPESGSIAHQAAGGGKFAKLVHRGNRMTSRQRNDLIKAVGKQTIGSDYQRVRPQLRQSLENSIEVTFAAGLQNVQG